MGLVWGQLDGASQNFYQASAVSLVTALLLHIWESWRVLFYEKSANLIRTWLFAYTQPKLFRFAVHLNMCVHCNLTVLALKMSWSAKNFTCFHVSYFFHIIILVLFHTEQMKLYHTQKNRQREREGRRLSPQLGAQSAASFFHVEITTWAKTESTLNGRSPPGAPLFW